MNEGLTGSSSCAFSDVVSSSAPSDATKDPQASAVNLLGASSLSWTSPGRKVRRDLVEAREFAEMSVSGAWAQSINSGGVKGPSKKGWQAAKAEYLQKHSPTMLNDTVYRQLIEQKWRAYQRQQLRRMRGGRTTREAAKAEFAEYSKAFQERQQAHHNVEAERPTFEAFLTAHPEVEERIERQALILRKAQARYHVTGEEDSHGISTPLLYMPNSTVGHNSDSFRFTEYSMAEFRRSLVEAVGGQPFVHFLDFMRVMLSCGVGKKSEVVNLWLMVDPVDRLTATPDEICGRLQVLLNAKRDRVLRKVYQRLHHRRLPAVDDTGEPISSAASPTKQVPVMQMLRTEGGGAPQYSAGAVSFGQFRRALQRPQAVHAAMGCLLLCLLAVVTEDGERPLFERPDADDGEANAVPARSAAGAMDDGAVIPVPRRAARVTLRMPH
eukprot:GGOE01061811.1.p1 GENE.GGOE01061811.1~~GGOE01061811.1.p1  ORF type:complete len:439 (-),score=94.87 GGOE01061811.1:101-1417(-)